MPSIKPLLAFLLLLALCLLPGCSRHSGANKELNILIQPDYVPQEVIDGFTRETGIKVNVTTADTNEAMVTKLLAGNTQYDIVQPSDYTVEALRKSNHLLPIDFSQVPNIANIDAHYLHLPFDPDQKYSVPYMTGTVGIIVNTAKITDPIHGYRDVFQPKYKGRIVVVDDGREMVSWALACLGHGVNDINAQTLAQARPLLASWMPLIKVFASESPKDVLLGGDCDLGVIYCGDAAVVIDKNPSFRYILPLEGAHQFMDTLCIPTTATNQAAATQFLNYILRPDVSAKISNAWPYTNPNHEARKLLTPRQLDNPASYPKEPGSRELFRDIGDESKDVDQLITDLKSGS